MEAGFSGDAIGKALKHLDKIVHRKKDMFNPFVEPKSDFKNILLLSYYQNMFLHLFNTEAIIACSLYAFGKQIATNDGVTISRLYQNLQFL